CVFVLLATLASGTVSESCEARGTRDPGTVPSISQPRTLTMWTHEYVSTPEFQVLREAAERFNGQQRVYKVELVSSLYRDYERWLRAAAVNGTLPCLVEFDGPFLQELAWSGYLQPIEHFIPARALTDFLPSV